MFAVHDTLVDTEVVVFEIKVADVKSTRLLERFYRQESSRGP
jgi:hypothetical protein